VTPMTNEQRTLLVGILSATDALWLPVRHLQTNAWQNVAEGRRAYRAGSGTGWRPLAGATETLRKQRQRALDTMSAAGLVELARKREARLVGGSLTARGEAMARTLCGLPGWQASLASEDELRRLADSKFAAVEGGWISERGLAGSGYGGDMDSAAFVLAENMLLPSLVSGRVVSLSDPTGRVWYRLADAGPPPDVPEPDVEPCDALRDLYDEDLQRHLHDFSTAKPRNPMEIGPCPLSAALRTCSD
jgi:hypothetical protein